MRRQLVLHLHPRQRLRQHRRQHQLLRQRLRLSQLRNQLQSQLQSLRLSQHRSLHQHLTLPSTRSGLSVARNDDDGVEAAAFEASSYHLAQASAAAAIGTAGRVVSTGAPSSFSHARIPPSRSATASWPKTLNIHQPRAALKRPAPSYTTT